MIQIRQGVDIVEISKFKEIVLRNSRFVEEIFTEQERVYCGSTKNPYLHLAGRFAAKESYLKALGTGMSGQGIDAIFQEIEVIPATSGKPEIVVRGWAEKIARKRKIRQCSVSISHTSHYAVATVILVGDSVEKRG
jgi:holo-[acyl-carrier protein] synthase